MTGFSYTPPKVPLLFIRSVFLWCCVRSTTANSYHPSVVLSWFQRASPFEVHRVD